MQPANPRPCNAGTLLASTGVEKDQQLMLWNPISGAQLGRSKLDEDYCCLEFLDEKTLCAINGSALAVCHCSPAVLP
jgi:hypothetical protein